MNFKLTKEGGFIISVVTLISGYLGYLSRPTIVCITTPCSQPSGLFEIISFAIMGGFAAFAGLLFYRYVK